MEIKDDLLKYVQQNFQEKVIFDFFAMTFQCTNGAKCVERALDIEPVVAIVEKKVTGLERLPLILEAPK